MFTRTLTIAAGLTAAAALVPSVAPAGLSGDYDKASQLPQVSTGIVSPDGYQPQLQGDATIVLRSAPDGYQPQLRRAGEQVDYVTVVDGERSVDPWHVALGSGLAALLAGMFALGLIARRHMRIAHT